MFLKRIVCSLLVLGVVLPAWAGEEKIDPRLQKLCRKMAREARAGSAVPFSAQSTRRARVNAAGFVQVYVKLAKIDDEALGLLRDHGFQVEIVNRDLGVVQGRLPFNQVENLSEAKTVRNIRRPAYAVTRRGSETSEGDGVHRAPEVRNQGFTGAGIKVGVISDGVDGLDEAVASGDLPDDVEVVLPGSGAEGTAMLEVIHDLAPGADLAFSSGGTDLEFIESIDLLRLIDCKVLVDDLGFFNQAFFEDGPLARKAQAAVRAGVSFFSSAGNEAEEHYEANFSGLGARNLGGTNLNDVHDFGGGDFQMRVVIPFGDRLDITFQWANAFGDATDDYTVHLFSDTGALLASSERADADDPFEELFFPENENDVVNVGMLANIVIERVSGAARRLEFYIGGGTEIQEFLVKAGSIFGHPAAAGVVAVGAVPADDPETIEDFSSRGLVRIFFPDTEVRNKPEACGTDDVSVSGAGGFGSPFPGTSAAAPHLAAIAALLLDHTNNLTPGQIRGLIQNNAVDLGDPGFDSTFGSGRADALNSMTALDNGDVLPPEELVDDPVEPTADSGGGGGGGGGCFVATAAYGSRTAPAVNLLRHFRNQCLLPNAPGEDFVRTYYANSPALARKMASSEMLRGLARHLLRPCSEQ